MRKERKNYSAEEKVAILRRHLLDKMPVSCFVLVWESIHNAAPNVWRNIASTLIILVTRDIDSMTMPAPILDYDLLECVS